MATDETATSQNQMMGLHYVTPATWDQAQELDLPERESALPILARGACAIRVGARGCAKRVLWLRPVPSICLFVHDCKAKRPTEWILRSQTVLSLQRERRRVNNQQYRPLRQSNKLSRERFFCLQSSISLKLNIFYEFCHDHAE
jgi:hypothetical protein